MESIAEEQGITGHWSGAMFRGYFQVKEQSAWGNVVFAPGRWCHNWSSKFHLEQIWTGRVDGVLSHSGDCIFPS
jgi:hypothetical protein